MKHCSICGDPVVGFGHNPQPIKLSVGARCCDNCNSMYVIPARLDRMMLGLQPTG